MTRRKAAPSVMGLLLPAVTLPPARKAAFSSPSLSTLVSARTHSSRCRVMGCPSKPLVSKGTTSRSNFPACQAAAAFWWLWQANSSCSRRVMPYSLARFSAVMPMEQ